VVKSADDKVSDSLLKDICKNGADLKAAPAASRPLLRPPGVIVESSCFAVFRDKSITVGDDFKNTANFEPGSRTKVDEVLKKYGQPSDREKWIAKEFESSIGLRGTVNWWGAVGIAGSKDGTITHVLTREAIVLDAKK
jgi:hypothetical protein